MKRQSTRNLSQKSLESLCGQLGADDGVDPRDFFKPPRQQRDHRKDWQLCRQVSETLSYVLSGDGDDILSDLIIRSVIPAPDAHRLLVSVSPFAADQNFDPVLAQARLGQIAGKLRAEVARSITRRKVPDLIFQIVVEQPAPDMGREEVSHD